jgi:hypothetical protein
MDNENTQTIETQTNTSKGKRPLRYANNFQLWYTDDMKQALFMVADKTELSVSFLIREFIYRGLKQYYNVDCRDPHFNLDEDNVVDDNKE